MPEIENKIKRMLNTWLDGNMNENKPAAEFGQLYRLYSCCVAFETHLSFFTKSQRCFLGFFVSSHNLPCFLYCFFFHRRRRSGGRRRRQTVLYSLPIKRGEIDGLLFAVERACEKGVFWWRFTRRSCWWAFKKETDKDKKTEKFRPLQGGRLFFPVQKAAPLLNVLPREYYLLLYVGISVASRAFLEICASLETRPPSPPSWQDD